MVCWFWSLVVGPRHFDCGKALVLLVFFGARVCGSFHSLWAKLSNAIRLGPTGQCCTHSKNVCVLTARCVRGHFVDKLYRCNAQIGVTLAFRVKDLSGNFLSRYVEADY